MKNILAALLVLFAVSGCSESNNDELRYIKWFKTEQEAIDYGIKEEWIKREDILGKIEQNHETFVFFKEEEKEGTAISLANIIKQDKQYAWDRIKISWLIKPHNDNHSHEVSWEFETQSKKKFIVYTGTTEKQSISIKTKNGATVKPKVDTDSGIYYYIRGFTIISNL
ncbi:hypothetical protein [Anoxybacteroides tepidamans]|uniref:hypothetical protein n=1 Tax=Anoxybacteroides tepidamans TaxID=265948 RepID=UPI00047F233F|nr:hypothetical protein [Anoxybacillus tepidamans]